jgi:hypothetical protein
MEAIIFSKEQFNELLDTIKNIDKKLSAKTDNTETSKNIYSNDDLVEKLSVSKSTLQNYRNKGLLKFNKVGRKLFYTEEQVQDFLNDNN